jgi:hypothetical protein
MFQSFPYALIMLTHRFLFDLATQNSKQHDQAAQGTDRNEQFLDYANTSSNRKASVYNTAP